MMDINNLKKEDLKLVIADIDGTLVNKGRILKPKTKEVIERLKKNGVEFALASGRPLDELSCLIDIWNCEEDMFTFQIGMNGGQLKDFHDGQIDEFFKIDPIHLKEILELMEPFDINPCIYYHGNILCKRVDEHVLMSIGRTNKKAIPYDNIAQMYSEPTAKIIFRMEPSQMDECEAFAKKHPSPYWNVFRTGKFNLEFGDSRINKSYPFKIFAETYGISLENMIAFGVNSNVNEMLKEAGWGVCLLNGTEDTKSFADDITRLSADEEGLAYYIEEKILNKFGW